jgi:hypothetical protein
VKEAFDVLQNLRLVIIIHAGWAASTFTNQIKPAPDCAAAACH